MAIRHKAVSRLKTNSLQATVMTKSNAKSEKSKKAESTQEAM